VRRRDEHASEERPAARIVPAEAPLVSVTHAVADAIN